MKRRLLFAVLAVVAICAAATDRFFIEDFTINAGETLMVSILLDNETAYTAFQTDIYLPEGLTVEQEDGDYIFDLTSRKGRDHIIASQVQADGAIRIMSYSPSIKTYSGNSGALVTFNVTATSNVGGPTTIELKNTLFTTKTGTEIAFNDEVCNVSIPSDRFEVDGIYYHKTSSNTVEVTYGDSVQYYSGDITIPNTINYEGVEYTVTAIGDSAFYRNYDLNTVIIPETVESIGNFAFKRCRWLSKVTCLATTPPTLGEQCFEDYAVDFCMNDDWYEESDYPGSGYYYVLYYPFTIPYDFEDDDDYDDYDWPLATRAMLYVPRDQYSDYMNSVWDSYFMFIVIIGNGQTAEPTIEVHEEYICGYHSGTSFSINSEEGQVYYCESERHVYDYDYGWHSYGGGIIPSHNYYDWSTDYGISIRAFAIAPGKEPSEVVGADGGWLQVLHYIDERDVTLRTYHLESDNIYYCFDYYENYDNVKSINNTSMTDDGSSNNRDCVYDNIYNYVYSCYFDDDDYYFVYPADEYIDDNTPLGVSCGVNRYFTVDMYINGYDEYVYDIIDDRIENCYYQGDISIPDSVEYNGVLHKVTSINYGAFQDCEQLTSVSIPETVSCIQDNAFIGCSNLASITCLATTPPRVYSNTFAEHYNTATLYVPYDALEAYKSADYWKEFVHIVGIGNAGDGDVDCDGKVSISDVTALIDYLLSGNAQSINEENADVDHDGAITISDVTTLIDYLLSGNWPVEPEPEPTPGVTSITVNGVTFNMVKVEGGTFTMGATSEQESDANDNEKPAHEVTLTTDYCIGETEVTQALWQAVMGSNPSYFAGDPNRPVECVSWNDCQTFITKLNEMTGRQFRLPTEAEWEFAARGGNKSQGYKFSGSNNVEEVAWYKGNIPSQTSGTDGYGTQPVATKSPNELGLYDMSGNVWEWCQDWFGSYSAEAQTDPTGPETGNNLVVRGGSWYNSAAKTCRVTRRNGCLTTDNAHYLGLRLAMDYTEEYTVNGVSFTMVPVKGGTFMMGATPEQEEQANDNEKPAHEVTLSDYSIGQTEVTQELWQAVMGTNPSKFNDNVNKPVETISWEDCQTFIATLNNLTGQNFRLPTEAEWEFAARGGMKSQGYKYSGSDDLNAIAWYNYNAYAVGSSSPDYGTHAVSTKAANELGLYDMTGNLWEWCQDWSGDYSAEDQINPTGPETGTNRIIRGGGWTNYPKLLRVAARSSNKPGFIGNFIGFRLAR